MPTDNPSSVSVSVSVSGSPTPSDRFQSKLKETKNFGDALIEIFSDLVELEIITWVAHKGEIAHETGNRLRTTINLIDGDIENELGSDFLQGGPYAELREFHELQVQKGTDTIANNMKILVEVGQKLAGFFTDKKDSEPENPEHPELAASTSFTNDRLPAYAANNN